MKIAGKSRCVALVLFIGSFYLCMYLFSEVRQFEAIDPQSVYFPVIVKVSPDETISEIPYSRVGLECTTIKKCEFGVDWGADSLSAINSSKIEVDHKNPDGKVVTIFHRDAEYVYRYTILDNGTLGNFGRKKRPPEDAMLSLAGAGLTLVLWRLISVAYAKFFSKRVHTAPARLSQ